MDRRGFLGSIIGTLVASQLPFRAIEALLPASGLRIATWTADGEVFWAPPIGSIENSGHRFQLVTKGLEPNREIIAAGASLVWNNLVIGNQFFSHHSCHVIPGDILNITYSCSVWGYTEKLAGSSHERSLINVIHSLKAQKYVFPRGVGPDFVVEQPFTLGEACSRLQNYDRPMRIEYDEPAKDRPPLG